MNTENINLRWCRLPNITYFKTINTVANIARPNAPKPIPNNGKAGVKPK